MRFIKNNLKRNIGRPIDNNPNLENNPNLAYNSNICEEYQYDMNILRTYSERDWRIHLNSNMPDAEFIRLIKIRLKIIKKN